MKAIVYERYGGPEVLQCVEIDRPVPAPDEVLIKVRAASVNPYDWHFLRGLPYGVRAISGFGKPKNQRLGADAAGVVEAVGESITGLKVGDEVYGTARGAFAEYACARESTVLLKPANVSFEQAACVAIAGCTALQALRDKGKLQAGQTVLINGAAGGVGTFAVQIAKVLGAQVTGVCSTRNVDLVRSIGSDHSIAYTRQDFTKGSERYDLLLDNVGNHSLRECRRVLKQNGICVGAGGTSDPWMLRPLGRTIAAVAWSLMGPKKTTGILAKIRKEDLAFLGGLIAEGRLTPVIDKRYRMGEIANAIRYSEEGHARGKIVISVGQHPGEI
jgi:NADPH:quinone reductase-like Zn-dependent oxidoreductase